MRSRRTVKPLHAGAFTFAVRPGGAEGGWSGRVLHPALVFLGGPEDAEDGRCCGTWYMQLVRVEEAFKTLKSDLDLRPIHHQVEPRVEAHILVAFLGLLPDGDIADEAAGAGAGADAAAVLETLSAIQMLDVVSDDRRAGADAAASHGTDGRAADPAPHAQAQSACSAPTQNPGPRRESARPEAPFVGQTFSITTLSIMDCERA